MSTGRDLSEFDVMWGMTGRERMRLIRARLAAATPTEYWRRGNDGDVEPVANARADIAWLLDALEWEIALKESALESQERLATEVVHLKADAARKAGE